jgi:hypothetical protein
MLFATNNKQCPGEKARPAEKKVDDLCLAYQRMRPWDNGKYDHILLTIHCRFHAWQSSMLFATMFVRIPYFPLSQGMFGISAYATLGQWEIWDTHKHGSK